MGPAATSIRALVRGWTAQKTRPDLSNAMVVSGIATRPVIEQCCIRSTPASIAWRRLSTEVVWVWTVIPARWPSSTMTRCCSGLNISISMLV